MKSTPLKQLFLIHLLILFPLVLTAEGTHHHGDELPIFDTHVHYKLPAWNVYPPASIIKLLKENGITKALVSSTPDHGTRMLYDEDSTLIIPFLRPYHDKVTSSNWHKSDTIIDYMLKRLERPIYAGLGEFHIHDLENADSEVIRKTVQLAVERDMYIHVHSDHRAIEKIFSYSPNVKILWAHAGMSDEPDVIRKMFRKYKNLWIDTSIREHDIAPNGVLDPEWKKLFLKYPERVTVGSDTWVNGQWANYSDIMEFNRNWLNQLPEDIARQIAYENAMRLFVE